MECKNNKSRADSCDEMAAALRTYGMDILYKGPRSKKTCNALKLLATLLSERDGALRQAALGTLMVVYELEGERTLWNLLGDSLTLQQKDMILERQKYSDKELAKKGIKAGYQVRLMLVCSDCFRRFACLVNPKSVFTKTYLFD